LFQKRPVCIGRFFIAMPYNRNMILGIDEVGRGPWAGPLVVGAVVLGGAKIDGLTDSKKLSKKRREQLNVVICEQAAGYGLGWVSADELDEIGLSEALRLATRRAVEQIAVPYHEIIIDGTINFLSNTSKGEYVTTMPKADLLIPSVSAASIIAKVARDAYMAEQDDIYPGYGFGGHAGYGVAKHRAAIDKLGVTPLHRLSFAPLVKYKNTTQLSESVDPQKSASFDASD
jgi:ribonuclease HII